MKHWKRTIVVVCAFVVFSCIPLFASQVEILPLSSPVYEEMAMLYRQQKLAIPSQAKPWSVAELQLLLSRLDTAVMGELERTIYQDILAETQRGSDQSQRVGAGITLSLEGYAHTNSETFVKDTDWVHGFDKRNPFAKLYFEFEIADFLYSYVDLSYGWGRVTYKDTVAHIDAVDNWVGIGAIIPKDFPAIPQENLAKHKPLIQKESALYSKPFLFNFPDIRMLEIDIPRRVIFALGGKQWNLAFARDKIDWGRFRAGNFVLDSHVDYHEYIRFKAFSDKLSIDIVTLFFDTHYSSANGWIFDGDFELFLTHRFKYRPLSWLSIALSENVMYRSPKLELKHFNPAFIFHNLNNSDIFNAIAQGELDIALGKGVGLYGQFVLDQATAPTEEGTKEAPAWGVAVGAEWMADRAGGIVTVAGEYIYATPMLYRRENVDFLMFHRYATNVTYKRVLVLDYIGLPYGGDVQVLQLWAGYRVPKKWEVALLVQGRHKGEMDFYRSHNSGDDNTKIPDILDKTPYGNRVLDTFVASLSAGYYLPFKLAKQSCKAYVQLDWVLHNSWTKDGSVPASADTDLQLTFGLQYSFNS